MHCRSISAASAHRLAKFIAWFGAVLAWLALGTPCFTDAQRRHRRRYGAVTAEKLMCALRNLVILQAAEYLPERQRSGRIGAAPLGFTRARPSQNLRAIGGSWLRRRLRLRGGFIDLVLHLIEALRHLRGLGARLAWLRRRGLTRRAPLIIAAPPTRALVGLCMPQICAADSS